MVLIAIFILKVKSQSSSYRKDVWGSEGVVPFIPRLDRAEWPLPRSSSLPPDDIPPCREGGWVVSGRGGKEKASGGNRNGVLSPITIYCTDWAIPVQSYSFICWYNLFPCFSVLLLGSLQYCVAWCLPKAPFFFFYFVHT